MIVFCYQPLPSKLPNVPPYNELDRKNVSEYLTKDTKKYPYRKNNKVTTTEMKKVKRSTLGVLPNLRNTTELDGLNVLIEGQCPPETKFEHVSPELRSLSRVEEANFVASATEQGKGPSMSRI